MTYEILERDEFRIYNRTFPTYAAALDQLVRFEKQLRDTGHITEPIVNGAFAYYSKSPTNAIYNESILVQIMDIENE